MYIQDMELRIKCLEIATRINANTSDTRYLLMDAKRIHDFALGKSDAGIDAALESLGTPKENSN